MDDREGRGGERVDGKRDQEERREEKKRAGINNNNKKKEPPHSLSSPCVFIDKRAGCQMRPYTVTSLLKSD